MRISKPLTSSLIYALTECIQAGVSHSVLRKATSNSNKDKKK